MPHWQLTNSDWMAFDHGNQLAVQCPGQRLGLVSEPKSLLLKKNLALAKQHSHPPDQWWLLVGMTPSRIQEIGKVLNRFWLRKSFLQLFCNRDTKTTRNLGIERKNSNWGRQKFSLHYDWHKFSTASDSDSKQQLFETSLKTKEEGKSTN